jgi:hypothetical protein
MWPFNGIRKQLEELKKLCFVLRCGQEVAERSNLLFYTNLSLRLDRIEKLQKQLLFRLGPGNVSIRITGETSMADVLLFVVYLPPKSAPDVVARELTVEIDGETQVLELDADSTQVSDLFGLEGSTVSLSLVDIDNADNRSGASVFNTTLKDTIAPPKPGVLGLEVTAERPKAPAAETPNVEADTSSSSDVVDSATDIDASASE